MAGISSLGAGSGILTSDLVDQLVAAERKPTDNRLAFETQKNEALLSAYGQLRSAVTELRLPMRQLSAPDNLTAYSVKSSNEDVGVTLDSSKASRGSYTLEVIKLAQAQSLASVSFSDKDATEVGVGTLEFKVGETTKTLTIDRSNNTLQGLANEINEAGMGVSASVIDTGSGFTLVMSSDETGLANAISLTANQESGAAGDLSRFNYNDTDKVLTQTIDAIDAKIKVNGIEITRASNNIENVVDGLSFELKKAEVTSTIRVEQDFDAVADRVQGFVDKFNALQLTISGLSKFNAETQQSSILTGDSTIRSVQSQLRNALTGIVAGLEGSAVRSLADVGVKTDADTGGLILDRDVFKEQLKNHPDDVTALFAEQGRTTDSQVEFVRSGINTEPGQYAINVTQAATRGAVTGSSTLGSVTLNETNNALSLKVDGETDVNLTLTAGFYDTPEAMVAELQEQLNKNPALGAAGRSVEVGLDEGNRLTFTSSKYGADSNVSITSVADGSPLGLAVATGTAGVDVAGTIDGKVAKGDGQVLYLSSGEGPASGLQVRIAGDQIGSRGSVTFIEGVAERAVNLVSKMVGPDGVFDSRTASINRDMEKIAEDKVKLEARIESFQARLVAQFSSADSLIAQLNNTLNFVTQQLEALAPQNNRRK